MGTDQIPDELWALTTCEGNRRAQLRHALTLTLRKRLQAVEDMAEVAERFRKMSGLDHSPDKKEPAEERR